MIVHWNIDKPHRCPRCHTVTVDNPTPLAVYTCCACGTRFARFPRLQRFLRHAETTCTTCTTRHPVPVDGAPFGFLRRRHTGPGTDAISLFDAWLYDTHRTPSHRDALIYLNTRTDRAQAIADLADWRSFLDRDEDDLNPVLAVVSDEQFDPYAPDNTAHRDGFLDSALDAYGIGILRPHPQRGRFHPDAGTFIWGLVAPTGLEGIYTHARHVPKPLNNVAAHLAHDIHRGA